MKKLLFLLMFLSNVCVADEAYLGFGVGMFNDADSHVGQNKYGELGYRSFVWDGIYLEYKGGFWGEGGPDQTRKAGAFIAAGPGLEVDLQPVEIRSGINLAAISSPDSQLGGYFPQFNEELYIGLRDKKGDGIGLQLEHISCATFCNPNQGRNALMLLLSQKW